MKSQLFNFFRNLKYRYQKFRYGFSDADLWSLDAHLAELILPRLKAFKEQGKSYPLQAKGLKQWNKILDEMIFAFDYYANHPCEFRNEKESIRIDRGLYLFYEYFHHLWT